MQGLDDFGHLQELISEWAEIGRVDLDIWDAEQVISVISGNPDFREKFVALLESRLAASVQ
ncbi:hypothetical protein [Fuscovulum ytuae]|uniref:Uncharacterized protein n=1 Tax=Fuscovulum ytuae TaxID=3042299 RepID=A0ABY8QA40_9RHOB|nr:hypothetical protein [Fuscovulum sp. YMD61]WGV17351.1 hypothetical protein QF092_06035 [Fuscovulum sp. YMD61]